VWFDDSVGMDGLASVGGSPVFSFLGVMVGAVWQLSRRCCVGVFERCCFPLCDNQSS